MNSTLSNVIIFAAGAAIGSAVTWMFVKKKYERIADEEIASVKRVFSKLEEKEDEEYFVEPYVISPDTKSAERSEYSDIVQKSAYITITKNEEGEEDVEYFVEPYVISPDEFGELTDDGYDTVSLYLYKNGVLENAITKELIDDEDIDRLIGRDSLNHFGEYEEDSVFVRNENNEIDYEILKVEETYTG